MRRVIIDIIIYSRCQLCSININLNTVKTYLCLLLFRINIYSRYQLDTQPFCLIPRDACVGGRYWLTSCWGSDLCGVSLNKWRRGLLNCLSLPGSCFPATEMTLSGLSSSRTPLSLCLNIDHNAVADESLLPGLQLSPDIGNDQKETTQDPAVTKL